MADLRLPGLMSGIDTAALVKQLMIVNSRRLATYQVKKLDYEKQATALDELRAKVRALDTAVGSLSDSDDLETYNTSSSDTDILTVGASSDANPGSHSIEINQLATADTWIHNNSSFDFETDYVWTDEADNGVFIFSYNNKECVINTVRNETTLEDMVNLINNSPDNPGVTASLLYQGGKYHLMLSGQETGEDYQISINSSSTEVWQAGSALTVDEQNAALTTKIIELDQFGEEALQGGEVIEITGTNRHGTAIAQVDLSLTENTTIEHLILRINEAFDGIGKATFEDGKIVLTDLYSGASEISIDLTYNANGKPATLTLPTMAFSKEGGSTTADIPNLAPGDFIETQDAQSSNIKIDGYPSDTAAELQTLALDSVATSGTFTLTFGGETTDSINSGDSTTIIQTKLNALDSITAVGGVTVGGTALDVEGNTTFQFVVAAGDVSMISIDAGNLTGPTTTEIAETTKGNDGWISRNSNSISDALTGVTLKLHDVTEADESIEITLSRNTSAVLGKVQGMINAYNGLVTFLEESTEYNAETKKMGILSRDIAVSLMESQARDSFIGIIDGFDETIDSFVQVSDIGLSFNGQGQMVLDTNDFNDAIAEDFTGVLELLGATKSGNSDSDTIDFYAASDKYTTAGVYDVEVEVENNQVVSAKIKLTSESTWRDAETWAGNLVTFNSDFDDNGDPLYPENSLQLTVDLSVNDTFTATVRVKQGVAGSLEDLLDTILEANGRLDISDEVLDDKIKQMESTIEREESRLEKVEARLIAKFARLEKTLTLLQQQYSTVNMLMTSIMGGT